MSVKIGPPFEDLTPDEQEAIRDVYVSDAVPLSWPMREVHA